ncbi:hypothetical protein CVT24_012779 [Panaeolus cyanescens]|uniref:DUF6699 domain-containing protein n=1 Tax=Panaeolus cyanescens TaxID=181874 RepID=A0A409W5X4_9AGAR|nr:hypothetical protein CVT24_012779 [Panaeolus cyanescens]
MSGPYVYTPQVEYRNSPYLAPYYYQNASPFIPDISLNASPFSVPTELPNTPLISPTSPFQPPNTAGLPAPEETTYIPTGYLRTRRPSWPGPVEATTFTRSPRRQRTRSFGEHPSPFQPPAVFNEYSEWPIPLSPAGYAPVPLNQPDFRLHPWLNADSRSDFVFNLSWPSFGPSRAVSSQFGGRSGLVMLTQDELVATATHPPMYRIRITCDYIPQWPITLEYNPSMATGSGYPMNPPPIKLGDVLSGIWNAMQMRISHQDWARLDPRLRHMVTRAFTERCAVMPDNVMGLNVRNQGVKRLDFLLGKVWFKGLKRVSDFEFKMILA